MPDDDKESLALRREDRRWRTMRVWFFGLDEPSRQKRL